MATHSVLLPENPMDSGGWRASVRGGHYKSRADDLATKQQQLRAPARTRIAVGRPTTYRPLQRCWLSFLHVSAREAGREETGNSFA